MSTRTEPVMIEDQTHGLTHYAPERPLVLLTDFPPDGGGGGGVILRSLLRPEDRARLVWMTLTPPTRDHASTVLLDAGKRSAWREQTWRAGTLAAQALAEAQRRQARAFWIVLHGAGVPIAARLAKTGALPVHVTVHDDPLGLALSSRRQLPLAPWIGAHLTASLRRADSVDVIGAAMAERYRHRYSVGSVVVHRGLRPGIAAGPVYDRARELSVGILGGVYKYQQLPALGAAVARAAHRLNVPGRLLVIGGGVHGPRLRADLSGQVDVEVAGQLSEAEGIRRLRDCFALYVNYPFTARFSLFRQTSFPTKLSTYVMAARPLLLHAPADSSIVALAGHEPDYALWWKNLDPKAGAALLEQLWNDPAQHASAHEAAERVRARYYDDDQHRRTLFTALNTLVPPLSKN